MPEIRITKSSYEHVLSELENIQNILYENIEDLEATEENLSMLQSGRAVDAQALKMQETKSNLEKFTNGEVANMIEIVDDLIDVIEHNLKPEYPNSVIIIDTDKIKSALNKTLSTFSNNSSKLKAVVENSDTFESIMKSRHQELDDNFSEALFNPIDEARQNKAENIFRSNEIIMKNINVYLAEELTFKNELDAVEDLIHTFDNFGNKFDPILDNLGNVSLYDNFMSNTMDVSHASQTISSMTPEAYEKQHIVLDSIHRILNTVGLWPGIIGITCDIINAVLYTLEALIFGSDTWDDVVYSLIGLVPGGKVGLEKALKDAEEIGFNPIKLLVNAEIDVTFAKEMILDFGVIIASLFSNSDGDFDELDDLDELFLSLGGTITEQWTSIIAAGLKSV